MNFIQPCTLPENALLRTYHGQQGYADCYFTDVEGTVTQREFVEAFYTTPLFKVERLLLGFLARRPSSDDGARRLAEGSTNSFAAWRVEGRADDQLLLCDHTGRTRSWLMVSAAPGDAAPLRTRLHFGSAVVPRASRAGASKRTMGFAFHALLGFHRLYSRLLLGAARSRIAADRSR